MAANGKRQDGDVDGAGSQTVEKDRSNFFDDGEPHLGKFAREGSKARRKEIGGDSGNNAHGDGTASELFAFEDVAFGGFQFAKDSAGAREKGLAKLGKATSSLRICWEREGWEMCDCSAARLNEPVSATAQK